MTTLAHLGKLTFGEEAAAVWDSYAERISQPSNVSVLEAVVQGKANAGIIPIENSIEGDVVDVMDYLMRDTVLFLTGEVILPVNQCLFLPQEGNLQDVQAIFSHPQALGQCRENIARMFPHAEQIAVPSTADGIPAMLAHPAGAAIAAKIAMCSGVELVREHFEDRDSNATRFLVVSLTNHCPPTGNDRTVVVFLVPDRPGALLRAITPFDLCGINMSNIARRPSKEGLGKYIFWVELEAHQEDERTKEALALMRRLTERMRVFGSCPRAI